MNHAYWGPSFSNGYVRQLLDERQEELSTAGCTTQLYKDEK